MRLKIIISIMSLTSVVTAQNTDEPKQLASLRESYTKARTAATAPIDKKYVDALGAMKLQLTKSGDLQGALAVEAEISKITALSSSGKIGTDVSETSPARRLSDFDTALAFADWLATTSWTVGSEVYTFKGGVLAIATTDKVSTRPFTVLENGKVSWDWATGQTATVIFSQNLESADHQLNGKTTYVIVRDKRRK
jgi:hypothetical protein